MRRIETKKRPVCALNFIRLSCRRSETAMERPPRRNQFWAILCEFHSLQSAKARTTAYKRQSLMSWTKTEKWLDQIANERVFRPLLRSSAAARRSNDFLLLLNSKTRVKEEKWKKKKRNTKTKKQQANELKSIFTRYAQSPTFIRKIPFNKHSIFNNIYTHDFLLFTCSVYKYNNVIYTNRVY